MSEGGEEKDRTKREEYERKEERKEKRKEERQIGMEEEYLGNGEMFILSSCVYVIPTLGVWRNVVKF